jgi:hypothetical protein
MADAVTVPERMEVASRKISFQCAVSMVHIHESSDKGIENRLRRLPWEEIKAAIF